jgi:hypothetical protein
MGPPDRTGDGAKHGQLQCTDNEQAFGRVLDPQDEDDQPTTSAPNDSIAPISQP